MYYEPHHESRTIVICAPSTQLSSGAALPKVWSGSTAMFILHITESRKLWWDYDYVWLIYAYVTNEKDTWTEGVLLMLILLSYFGVTSWRNDVTAYYVTSVAK